MLHPCVIITIQTVDCVLVKRRDLHRSPDGEERRRAETRGVGETVESWRRYHIIMSYCDRVTNKISLNDVWDKNNCNAFCMIWLLLARKSMLQNHRMAFPPGLNIIPETWLRVVILMLVMVPSVASLCFMHYYYHYAFGCWCQTELMNPSMFFLWGLQSTLTQCKCHHWDCVARFRAILKRKQNKCIMTFITFNWNE